MVMTSLRIPVLAAMTMTSAGCFDVSGGEGAPLLIDDFDSGTLLPADPHFDQWRCGRYKPNSKQDCDCGYDDRTYRSKPNSMRLHAEIQDDPADDESNHGGAQVFTQATVPVDLSRVRRIAFDAMLAPLPSSISTGAILYVELHCSLAPSIDGPPDGDLYVQHAVDPSDAEWRSYVIDVTEKNFTIPTNFPDAKIIGGLPACIGRVDGIHFSVNAQLKNGQTGTVDLHIDDLYLE
jgi:hypothetical protein